MLRDKDLLALGGAVAVLRASDVPAQTAPDRRPDFFSRPETVSILSPLPPTSRWTPAVTFAGGKGRVTVSREYVATVMGDLAASGIVFRLTRNGRTLSSVALDQGVDRFKDSPTSFPVRWQPCYLSLQDQDIVTIDYKNPLGSTLVVAAGFRGWSYMVPDASEAGGNKVIRYADAG
jgi:hypothetical protein